MSYPGTEKKTRIHQTVFLCYGTGHVWTECIAVVQCVWPLLNSFLYEQRVHLENMGAHDIVDGNARLTLGLIWTIILRWAGVSILLYHARICNGRSGSQESV